MSKTTRKPSTGALDDNVFPTLSHTKTQPPVLPSLIELNKYQPICHRVMTLFAYFLFRLLVVLLKCWMATIGRFGLEFENHIWLISIYFILSFWKIRISCFYVRHCTWMKQQLLVYKEGNEGNRMVRDCKESGGGTRHVSDGAVQSENVHRFNVKSKEKKRNHKESKVK